MQFLLVNVNAIISTFSTLQLPFDLSLDADHITTHIDYYNLHLRHNFMLSSPFFTFILCFPLKILSFSFSHCFSVGPARLPVELLC